MKNLTKIQLILAAAILSACSGNVITNTATTEIENTNHSVQLTQEQITAMDIQSARPEKMNLAYSIETNGMLELPPQNKATLSAIISGRVKNILVIQGDYVKKGQLLASLENPDFLKLQQDYLTAKNDVNYFEKEFERAKILREKEINSEKSFAKTETDLKDAQVRCNGLKAQLELIGINLKQLEAGEFTSAVPVRSPIDGYVRTVEINLGQYINPSDALFEIVDNEHLHLSLNVFEKDIAKIKEGQNVHFYTSSNPEDVLEGTVFSVGKAFEKDLKAIKVYADIADKREYLIPGMYVNGHIELDSNMTYVLPKEALIEEAGIWYVFSPGENNKLSFEKIQVQPGASEGNKTEVIFINSEDAQREFVTKGAYYLNAEMNKEAE
ncbi:MAG: efflux RND transporter periplasmic adaptor subunit [Crocinitomicaceae bacterium]|nr:efflux RND transporter periplasmic adaptor subunit [Crocinitomicaceae bacterium]